MSNVFIAVSVVLWLVLLVADGLGTEAVPLKKLRNKDESAAREARDSADRMRGDLEGRISGPPGIRQQMSQEEIEAESAKIEQAYQDVIERYPHTEIAAYCAGRLSGFYVFRGKVDKAVELMEKTAKEYAGTSAGNKAVFEMGLIHAQTKHDPAEAIKWFSRISKPDSDEYGMNDKLYLSAQQQIAKCELKLRQDSEAQDRTAKLKETYPQYAQELERSYQFEVDSRNNSGNRREELAEPEPRRFNIFSFTPAIVGVVLIIIAVYRLLQERRRRL